MIMVYILCAVLGCIFFLSASKITLVIRVMLSIGIFLMLSIIATIVIVRVGDRPPTNSVTVDPGPTPNNNSDK